MKERNFQSEFNKWVKYVYKKTAAFELKLCKGKSLPFSTVAPHQVQALESAKNGVLVYKIPDVGYQNPFDSFSLAGVPAFVVIRFYESGKTYLIDINDFVNEQEKSSRKSIGEERAEEISSRSF